MKKLLGVISVFALALLMAGCFTEKKDDKTQNINTQTNVSKVGLDLGTAGATGIINVIVLDRGNNPVPGVVVSNGGNSAATDAQGNVRFTGVAIGGANQTPAEYNLLFTKPNYVSISIPHVSFSEETLVDPNTKIEIDTAKTSGTAISNDSGTFIVGKLSVVLSNASRSVVVYMDELVSLQGTLILPPLANVATSDAIKVVPVLTLPADFQNLVPMSKYEGEVTRGTTGGINFKIKNVPRTLLGGYGSTFTFKVFVNNRDYAEYYYDVYNLNLLTETAVQDLASATGQRTIKLVNPYILDRYYSLAGTVYTDLTKATKMPAGVMVILNNGNTAIEEKVTYTDAMGKYIFREIKSSAQYPYSVRAEDFDTNNDGRPEYINGEKSDDIVIGKIDKAATTADVNITRDIWYAGAYNYSISGKVETGIAGETKEGIKVNLQYKNNTNTGTVYGKIAEVATDANGVFTFTNVAYKDVRIVITDLNTDETKEANFLGVIKDVTNSGKGNIEVGTLFMAANKAAEPNYMLEIEATNYTMVKENVLVVKPNAVEPNGEITVAFKKSISAASQAEIEKTTDVATGELKKVVKLKGASKYVDVTYTFAADLKSVTIKPVMPLIEDNYTIEIDGDLSTEAGYKYRLGNTINADLAVLKVDVNTEDYRLKLVSTNFVDKDEYGEFAAYTQANKLKPDSTIQINFDKEISAGAIAKIEGNKEKIVNVTNMSGTDIAFNYVLTVDKKGIIITPTSPLKEEFYTLSVNADLAATAGYGYKITNNISDLEIIVDIAPYQLKVVSATFMRATTESPAGVTTFEAVPVATNAALTIAFNLPVSLASMNDIVNEGGEIVSITPTLGNVGVALSGDGKAFTLTTEKIPEIGAKYTVTLNSKLKAEAGYKYDVQIKAPTVFTDGLEIIKVNLDIAALTPAIAIPEDMRHDYAKDSIVFNWDMTGKIYKDISALSADYLTASVKSYSMAAVELDIPLAGLTNERKTAIVDGLAKFEIYAKVNSEKSIWTKLGEVDATAISSTDCMKGYKMTTVDVTSIVPAADILRWGTKVYLTIIPVDSRGKKAAFDMAKTLVIEDKKPVEISAITAGSVLNPSAKTTLTLNEYIDFTKTWSVSVTGVNANIGLTLDGLVKPSHRIDGDVSKIDFNAIPTAQFTVASEYNIGVTTSGVIILDTTKGLYNGMKLDLVSDMNTAIIRQIVVDKIVSGTVIEVTPSFDVKVGDKFVISKDNTEIFDRLDQTTSIYGTDADILNIITTSDVTASNINTNEIDISIANTTYPLLGIKNGDTLTFELKNTEIAITGITAGTPTPSTINLDSANATKPLAGAGATIDFLAKNFIAGVAGDTVTMSTAAEAEPVKKYVPGDTITFINNTTREERVISFATVDAGGVTFTSDDDLTGLDNNWYFLNSKTKLTITKDSVNTTTLDSFTTNVDLTTLPGINLNTNWITKIAPRTTNVTVLGIDTNLNTATVNDVEMTIGSDTVAIDSRFIIKGLKQVELNAASSNYILGSQVTAVKENLTNKNAVVVAGKGFFLALDTDLTGYGSNATDDGLFYSPTNLAAKELVLADENIKYTIGDKLILDIDTSRIARANSNKIVTITGIVPVYKAIDNMIQDASQYLYKYTFAENVNTYAVNTDVTFNPTIEIKIDAEDSNGNKIQGNKDEIKVNMTAGEAGFATQWKIQ